MDSRTYIGEDCFEQWRLDLTLRGSRVEILMISCAAPGHLMIGYQILTPEEEATKKARGCPACGQPYE